jgi:hypothetical protein
MATGVLKGLRRSGYVRSDARTLSCTRQAGMSKSTLVGKRSMLSRRSSPSGAAFSVETVAYRQTA